jgi:hypothetical protein
LSAPFEAEKTDEKTAEKGKSEEKKAEMAEKKSK